MKEKTEDTSIVIGPPKTPSGKRFIPMTTEVEKSMKQLVEKARKMGFEQYIDGYTGFIVRTREDLCEEETTSTSS